VSELARVTVRDEDDLRVVTVAGEVDVSNVAEVSDATVEGLPNSSLGVILDFTRLTYIDSAGIAYVFDIAERLGRRGQSLALVVPPASTIRRALEVTDVGAVAALVSTLEAARRRVLPNDDQRTA